MKLLIAVPALNEEESIDSTIRSVLAAREEIIGSSPITVVDVTVVSDGSTDRTVELARKYTDEITLVVFEKNRGYGAAIKEAWSRSDADVLAFLDADGTCDPRFFGILCTALEERHADVVLGSRMNSQSRMPFLRKLGNSLFGFMLSFFSSTKVKDTASGMRVVRRSSLPKLMPLPDGLHFTPAMSARAILSDDLKIVEVDMPYHERQGDSKLRVLKDGARFLKVILDSVFLYRPSRLLNLAGILSFMAAGILMIPTTMFYLENHRVLEWMIYRFVVSTLIGTASFLFFSTAYISEKIVAMTLSERSGEKLADTRLSRFVRGRTFWTIPALLTVAGVYLVIPSFIELVKTGATYEHWSRFIVMSFLLSVALILVVTRILDHSLGLILERLKYLEALRFGTDLPD
jgi:glycosyltransferase involved in cell wall biosynthesis